MRERKLSRLDPQPTHQGVLACYFIGSVAVVELPDGRVSRCPVTAEPFEVGRTVFAKNYGGDWWWVEACEEDRVMQVVARVAEVLGSTSAAKKWMATPCEHLDGMTPVSLLDRGTEGAERVNRELDRMVAT